LFAQRLNATAKWLPLGDWKIRKYENPKIGKSEDQKFRKRKWRRHLLSQNSCLTCAKCPRQATPTSIDTCHSSKLDTHSKALKTL